MLITQIAVINCRPGLHETQEAKAVVQTKYHNLTEAIDAADDKPYKVMGDVFTNIYEGTSYYESKNASYDPGSSEVTFNTDLTNGSEIISNVTLSGQYHNFSINTDIVTDGMAMADRMKLKALSPCHQ